MSTPWVHPFDRAPNMNGIRVIKSDDLPTNTMIVSADIYEALAATPEERATVAAAKLHEAQTMADRLSRIFPGLSPTGRKPNEPSVQELPKPPAAPDEEFKDADLCPVCGEPRNYCECPDPTDNTGVR